MKTLRIYLAVAATKQFIRGQRLASNWGKKQKPGEWWFATVKEVKPNGDVTLEYDADGHTDTYDANYMQGPNIEILRPTMQKRDTSCNWATVEKSLITVPHPKSGRLMQSVQPPPPPSAPPPSLINLPSAKPVAKVSFADWWRSMVAKREVQLGEAVVSISESGGDCRLLFDLTFRRNTCAGAFKQYKSDVDRANRYLQDAASRLKSDGIDYTLTLCTLERCQKQDELAQRNGDDPYSEYEQSIGGGLVFKKPKT